MITPDGTDCRFYYQDFMRGRAVQECRLVKYNNDSAEWKPTDCALCGVPEILANNFNPDLVLQATIKKGLLGLGRKIEVRAFCSRHLVDVENPIAGCPQCAAENPGIKELFEGL